MTPLTAGEVAKTIGISVSVFLSNVARGQAPQPAARINHVDFWSVADLRRWRQDDFAAVAGRWARAEFSRKLSFAREWQSSTLRDLAQIRLTPVQAHSLLIGITPSELDAQTFADSQWIIGVRRQLRARLSGLEIEQVGDTSEAKLIAAAAQRVADGEDAFVARADITVELVKNGHAERLLPLRFDPAFWTSQSSADDFERYLTSLEAVDVPDFEA